MATAMAQPVGDLLREWRQRRRMSQLDLASEADISTRHLSFLETGRAQPSRDMVLHLAEQLEVPLRERNVLLVAAGFAPVFAERPLEDPALQSARKAVDLVLAGHEPYPALAVDRHWTLVAANGAVRTDHRRRRPVAAAAARQRAAPEPASQGPGPAHRQSAGVARAPARPAAPPGRGVGRPGARRIDARARCLSGADDLTLRPTADGARVRGRRWCPCSSAREPARCPSSAPPPCSARRSTSRCRSWRWKPSSPPTPPPPTRSAASLERPAESCCGLRCRLVTSIHHEHRCEHFEQNGTGDLNAR